LVIDKIQKDYKEVTDDDIRNYKLKIKGNSTYADIILTSYGFNTTSIDWKDDKQKSAALYLVYKTLSITNRYPIYHDFISVSETNSIFKKTRPKDKEYLTKLVKIIKDKDKSHVTLKVRQVLHLLNACSQKNSNIKECDFDNFEYDDYVKFVGGDPNSKKMSEIQEYLPPSFFTAHIELDHYRKDGKDNKSPIPLERLSAGERQFLYTFSTFIYHILNILSIQSSNNVRYRRFNLILDEMEICFHPEYQRRFINELVGYITRLYMNSHACFNIIIVTHSPFVLSDVPRSNILWMKEGIQNINYERNPFAANVNDILRDSFFLENGFIGEFVKKKILSLIDYLTGGRQGSWNLQEAKDFIADIGEPLLKNKLEELIKQKQ
jgi:ribosomal protein S17E